jgi:putative ABC transport system permease protein
VGYKDYFQVLGLQPVLGRTFSEAEASFKPKPVIILGYDLWQRKFNGHRNILGKTIRISRWETPPVVIGVMPPGVRFLPSPTTAQEPNYNPNALVDYWIPAAPDPARLKESGWNVVGRLRNGITVRQAQAELSVLTQTEANSERDFEGTVPEVQPLAENLNQEGSRILLPLLSAAALVLLIACGNAASLLLVRGLQRQQEYAVRCAMGISRGALFWQASSESLLIALMGTTFGIGLAFGIVKIFKLIARHAIPRLDAVTTIWPMLVGGAVAAILAILLAGLFPALRAARLDPAEILKSAGPRSSAGRGERRLLRLVAMFQTALTLALLIGASLLIRTMVNISRVRAGFDVAHILTMSVTAVQGNWADFHQRALERVSGLPGVRDAAFAWGVPLTGNSWPDVVEVEGQPAAVKAGDRLSMPLRSVTTGYFKLMGMRILEGRDVRSTDGRKAPNVALVNQAFRDRFFPHTNAIGKKLWLQGRNQPPTQIIGIVSNGRTDDLTTAGHPEIYLSLWQASAFSKHLVIRAAGDPRSLISPVRRELRAIDPTVAVENVKTLDEIRGDSLASRTFTMQLLVGFSLVGSALTLIGIYGVLALSVASRRREIAIRTAIGAERKNIRNLVFGEGLRLIAFGVLAGIVAAILLSRILQSLLFAVESTDPASLIGVGLLFTGVGLLACWVPVRRAERINPVEVLRYE